MSYFSDKNRIKIFDALRLTYFVTFLLSFALTEIGRYIYRPYIYENSINDFGLADSMGNLGGIVVQIFFGLSVLNSTRKKGLRLISFFTIGYVVYEVLQLYLPKGTFDWKDIYGTLIGGVFSLLLFLLIHAAIKVKKTTPGDNKQIV
jgi:glycopeptide antibiotics resistance protein